MKNDLDAESDRAEANITALENFGDATQLAQDVNEVKTELNNARGTEVDLDARLDKFDTSLSESVQKISEITTNYNVYASTKLGDYYTVVDFKRADNTLYCKSTLSNADSNGHYQTCTVDYYNTDGTTIKNTYTWALTYDADGKIISKVVA